MKSPTHNRIVNQNKYLQEPLDCPSVWFGDFSDTPWALAFLRLSRRSRQMKKEYVISVELDERTKEALDNIRWKHIDIDAIVREELQEYIRDVIKAYGEIIR